MEDNSLIIYKSSAGSGKTYTLVFEYLKLVLRKPSLYRSILAITFTNKATEEMKTRIVRSLAGILEGREPSLTESLSSATGIAASDLGVRAGKVMEYILHDYSGFSVSTIDSFFSRIVRSLARELRLPLRFDLETDTDMVGREITYMLFEDIARNQQLKTWLQQYIFDKLDDEKGWLLEHEIRAMARQLFDERFRLIFPEGSGTPKPEFIAQLKDIKKGFESALRDIALEFFKILNQHNLTVDDFAYKKSGVAGYFEKIGKKVPPDKYEPGVRFIKAAEQPGDWVSKSSPRAKFILELAEKELMPLARQVIDYFSENFAAYCTADCVLQNAYMAGIIGTLDQKLIQYRDEKDVVMISDNNLFLHRSIGDQDAPFIFEKSGNRYTHLMIDEFQDTSDFQWMNLFPLVQNALGSGNYTLVVGDAKQSIYRWRGGNMSLLNEKLEEQLIHFREITGIKTLGTNYRSRERIVTFNNFFFDTASEASGLTPEYPVSNPYNSGEHKQSWIRGNNGEGYVKIQVFEDSERDVDEETGEETEAVKWQQSAGEETVAAIRRLLDSGFSYRDIAILTRTNRDAKRITSVLIENGITSIISPESMQLNRSPKIQFLISILTYLNDTTDEIALSNAVYYIHGIRNRVTDENLHLIFSPSDGKRGNLLPKEFRIRESEFRKTPLFDLVEELTALFSLGDLPDAYLQRFGDVILEYYERNPSGIANFLEWWEENENKEACSVVIPSDVNAIRVMSIHKSKGLQFPVVIIPYADWKMVSDHKDTIWVTADQPPYDTMPAHPVKVTSKLEESFFSEEYLREIGASLVDNLNLLYVAFTRAEEQLYVYTKGPGKSDSKPYVSGAIRRTLILNPELSGQCKITEARIFEFGSFAGKLDTAVSEMKPVSTPDNWISNPWQNRLHMLVNRKKIASSDPDKPVTDYGIHFHKLLSGVFRQTDTDAYLAAYYDAAQPDNEFYNRLKKELNFFMNLAAERGWFATDYEILNETELLLPDGTLLRPDRLLVHGNHALVIDYKTGAENPHHISQVKQYGEVLREMGFLNVEMYLVYPALEKVLEVQAA